MRKGKHSVWYRAARFFLLAGAAQLFLLLAATPEGLSRLYPLAARAASVRVTTGDNSYTDYFPLRESLTEADFIVVGVDFSVEETYLLLTDLLAAMKNERNIGTVFVDYPNGGLNRVSAVISSATEEEREIALNAFREEPAAVRAFIERLRSMNDNYPPRRKYTGGTVLAPDGADFTAEMLRCAAETRRRSGRPVLICTDTANLNAASGFRTSAGRFSGHWLYVQCLYETGRGFPSSPNFSLVLVDSARLAVFDDFYAFASRRIGGRFPSVRHSEAYSTPCYFWMKNGTPLTARET